jgi:serine/threonine protein kinase
LKGAEVSFEVLSQFISVTFVIFKTITFINSRLSNIANMPRLLESVKEDIERILTFCLNLLDNIQQMKRQRVKIRSLLRNLQDACVLIEKFNSFLDDECQNCLLKNVFYCCCFPAEFEQRSKEIHNARKLIYFNLQVLHYCHNEMNLNRAKDILGKTVMVFEGEPVRFDDRDFLPIYVNRHYAIYLASSGLNLLKMYHDGFDQNSDEGKYFKTIKNRSVTWKQCDSVVQTVYAEEKDDNEMIVLLKGVNMSLPNYLYQLKTNERVPTEMIYKWCSQIGKAFYDYHSHGWLLRLRSLENLFICKGTKMVKVEVPFQINEEECRNHNLSKSVVEFNRLDEVCWQQRSLTCVTKADASCDMYFYGAVIYYLFTNRFPYLEGTDEIKADQDESESDQQLIARIWDEQLLGHFPSSHDKVKEVIRRCVSVDYERTQFSVKDLKWMIEVFDAYGREEHKEFAPSSPQAEEKQE